MNKTADLEHLERTQKKISQYISFSPYATRGHFQVLFASKIKGATFPKCPLLANFKNNCEKIPG